MKLNVTMYLFGIIVQDDIPKMLFTIFTENFKNPDDIHMILIKMILMNKFVHNIRGFFFIRVMRKPDFCLCENKAADQLCSFRYSDKLLTIRFLF